MVEENFKDLVNIPDSAEDFVIDLSQDLELKIVFAGSFTTDVGEVVDYDDHIKLSQAGFNLKITAFQLASLAHALNDKDVHKEVKSRFDAEMKILDGVGF